VFHACKVRPCCFCQLMEFHRGMRANGFVGLVFGNAACLRDNFTK
jgi:hypothetical protein